MAELIRSSKSLSVHSPGMSRNRKNNAASTKASQSGKSVHSPLMTEAIKPVQTPELDAAVGNTPDFVAPSAQTAMSEQEYNTQKEALSKQLENLNQQYRWVQIDQGGDHSDLESQIAGIESQLSDLENQYAGTKYSEAYGRMTEETLAGTQQLGALLTEQQELIRRQSMGAMPYVGKWEDSDQYRINELGKQIASIRRQLAAEGFSEEEIDSLGNRSVQDYNAQQTAQMRQEAYNKARDRNGAGNLGVRILNDTAAGVGALDILVQNLTAGTDAITGQRELVDHNTAAQQFVHRSDAVTQAHNENIAENMAEKHGEGTERAEKATNRRVFMNNVLASMGTSTATIALTPVLGPAGAAMIQGSSAAAKTMHEYHNNGYSDGQALAMGLIAGAVETVTEKIGIDNLFALKGLGGLTGAELMKQLGLNIAKQSAVEGAEEGLSTVMNTLAEFVVLADENTMRRDVEALVAQGMGREDAEKQVLLGWVKGLGSDVLGGAISGALFGVGGSFAQFSARADAAVQQQEAQAEQQEAAEESSEPVSPLIVEQQEQNTATGKPVTAEELADILMGEESESTVVNTDPAEHTAAEQHVIEEYQASTDEGLVAFMEQSIQNRGANKGRYELKPVSDRAAADIKRITGVDTTGNKTVIEQRIAEHIYDRHGPNGQADHSMRDLNDFGRIQYVLDNYDDVEAGGTSGAYQTVKPNGKPGQAKTVIFSKAVNGTYYVIEAVPDTKRKTTFIVSAYMSQNKTGDSQTADAEAPAHTAKPENAISPVDEATTGAPAEINVGRTSETNTVVAPSGANIAQDGPVVNGSAPYHPINEQGAASAQATYGRNPVQVPVTNFEGHLTSKTASTIINSGLTPNGVAQSLTELLNKGELSRIRFADADAVADAKQTIAEKGFAKALEEFKIDTANGQRGKGLMARGIELFNMAAQSGDVMTATDIAVDIVDSAREQAQAIQVLNLFNKATPEGRVYFAVKGMDKLISKMEKKYGDRAKGIKVNEGLLSDYYEAVKSGNEQAVKETWQEVQKDIAAQIPPNWADCLNAWRYLAMLGNPKTHIRNFAGNAAFMPVRYAKNVIGAGLEKITGTSERTKSVLNPLNAQDRQLMQLAWQDYAAAMDGTDTGRYDESTNEIDRMRQVLPGTLDKVAKWNTKQMAREDRWFSQPAYMDALAGWFKANNITPDQAAAMMAGENAETFAKAREYAIREAKKATFQDVNDFSEGVSKFGRSSKGGRFLMDAVLPFKRTPANVLMRSIEYSPAYLMKGLKEMAVDVRSGKTSAAEALDHLASGLTGTGIMGLGFLLAKMGVLRGSGSDDDKQAAFDKLQGKQDYSLTFGDTSLTIDWMAPAVLPLFVGAELYDVFSADQREERVTAEDYLTSILSIADPILETTMLSGINDLINSVGYSDAGIMSILGNVVANYLGSFLPTVGGQIERTFDTKRQETYRYNDSVLLNSGSQYDLANLLNKVPAPGVDYGQIDYVDAWGRTEDYSNPLFNAINQLANPSYVSEERTTEIETELQRLYDAGNGNVFPTRRSQSDEIKVYDSDGNLIDQRHLTAEEYEQYNRTKGQTSLNMVSQLMDSDLYGQMDDATKAAAVSRMYDYANAVALLEVSPNAPVDSWITNAMNADNTARYLQVYSTYGYASDKNHRDYEAMESAVAAYGSMTQQDREALAESSDLEKLYEASQSGVSAESWYKAYDAVSGLDPLPGNTSVSTYQKLEAVLDNSSGKDADVLIPQYLGELQAQKYEIARAEGFSAAYFVDAYRVLNTVTSDKNSSGNTIAGSKKRNFIAALVEIDPAWQTFAGDMYDLLNSEKKDLSDWSWSWR